MSLPVVFLMIVLKKSALRRHYPGGEAGFRERCPYAAEDRYLFGLASMSWQDVEEYLTELSEAGIDLARDGAIADRRFGVLQSHPDMVFTGCGPADFPGLEVRLVRDDPAEMAREGEGIVQWLIARGFSFDVPPLDTLAAEEGR